MNALPLLISTDSHVMEPDAVWEGLSPRLLATFRAEFARRVSSFPAPAGVADPHRRLAEQDRDGVQAEILFPTSGAVLFGFDDAETQQSAFALYNDYLAAFCKAAPTRLLGIACISAYDIPAAVREMHRALDMGLVGIMVWQVPDPKLPFKSEHYEPLWAAAAEAGVAVHLHSGTGHSSMRLIQDLTPMERLRGVVNQAQHETNGALFDMIFSGAFDRHPDLKLVLAESECGWLPFVLQQWDYIAERVRKKERLPIDRKPSEIFEEHVYCTWLDDFSGTRHFSWWGQNNMMWSNDYPRANTTFPNSREKLVRHIDGLPQDVQGKLVRDNAIRLYNLRFS